MTNNFFANLGRLVDIAISTASETVAPLPAQPLATSPSSATSISATATSVATAALTQTDECCRLCHKGDHEDRLLICDGCECFLHTYCINLPNVPPGDWFCPRCVAEGKQKTESSPIKGDTAVVYERVSSAGQNAPEYGRVGLETQRFTIQEFCMKRGLRIRHTFTDVGSARNLVQTGNDLHRTQHYTLEEYGQMLTFIRKESRKHPVVVLVYSVSRFGRNLNQVTDILREIHHYGASVFSVSENISSHDPHFLTLVASAQQQSDDLSRVMKASVQRRREQGHFIGQPPFGYEVYRDTANARKIRPNPNMAEQLAKITNNRATAEEIADEFDGNVERAPGRFDWTKSHVSTIRRRLVKLGFMRTRLPLGWRRLTRSNLGTQRQIDACNNAVERFDVVEQVVNEIVQSRSSPTREEYLDDIDQRMHNAQEELPVPPTGGVDDDE